MVKALRLVSYNILEGFRPLDAPEAERRKLDRERADAAIGVVAGLRPDIMVVNEALFCRAHEDRHTDYGALFAFPYETAALYDGAWGNAILSRFPITRSHELQLYHRGGLTAVIETSEGPLTVASYHPHPAREPESKALDFAQLLTGLTGPLIVCGDLNCISPEDVIDRDRLVEAFRKFHGEPAKAVDQFIDSGRLVFAGLAKHGLHDAIPPAGRRYSIPTDLINLDKSSGIRIDHILANDAIEVDGGEVVHSTASNRASDHYPVMLDFRIRAT